MAGPFTSYEGPNVFTRTQQQAPGTSVNVGRVPVFIGVGQETLRVRNDEMVRGSSAVVDTLVSNEDVSARFILDDTNPNNIVLGPNNGLVTRFKVRNYPIVRGDGNGTVATEPKNVLVTVNHVPVPVAQVKGDTGEVILESPPAEGATIKVTYHFKRTDTRVTDDVSLQANGDRTSFRVYQGPMVDGRNGGITTTDPSHVVVKVNDVQVIPQAVDGANRLVTLAEAPPQGSTVKITYWFNTYQDTFDFLKHDGITDVVGVGFSPDRADFINTVDYIIDGDKILWGSAATIRSGAHTVGKDFFDDSQVRTTLIDNKMFLEEAPPVVDLTVTPPVASRQQFRLSNKPTLGNGRDTILGQDLYNAIANGRIDVTTNRPDLLEVRTGTDLKDALSRPAVPVLEVDGENSTFKLKNPVQLNHRVFCTYYYNRLGDDTFTIINQFEGASEQGKYSIRSAALGQEIFGAVADPVYITKGTGLSATTVNFPSGSELMPDIVIAGGAPVVEEVTVTFTETTARAANLTGVTQGDFNIIPGVNDKVHIQVDAGPLTEITLPPSDPATVMGTDEVDLSTPFTGETLQLRINNSDPIAITLGSTDNPISSVTGVAARINTVLAGHVRFNGAIDNSTRRFAVPGGTASAYLVLTTENMNPAQEAPVGSNARVEILTSALSPANVKLKVSSGLVSGVGTSAADVAAEINSVYPGGVNPASEVDDTIVLRSNTTGMTSFILVSKGTGSPGAQAIAAAGAQVLGFEAGQHDNGEDEMSGFTVTSSDVENGSSGTGVVGQTYTDARTGVRFTVLPQETGANYPIGATSWFRFNIGRSFVANANLPNLAINGTETIVASTDGIGVGDTAILRTYDKAGNEPNIGDFYYLTYDYEKPQHLMDTTFLFTRFKDVEANFGTLSGSNRLTLGSFLAILNGAQQIACRQVPVEPGKTQAAPLTFIKAIQDLSKPLPGGTKPYVICPLTTSTEVISFMRLHCEVQSSIRYRNECVGVFGFAAGTRPTAAQDFARTIRSNRMIAVYPDAARIGLTNELGETIEVIVDGSFLAAALVGQMVAPAFDVATPLTRRSLVGFRGLTRQLDSVEMNQTAAAGITVLEDLEPNLQIRHGLTTDMGTVLSREITVTMISDLVQIGARQVLNRFVGVKFLSRVLNEIEDTLAAFFNSLVQQEIIAGFRGVSATQDPDDPTLIRVEAFYAPTLPINWIVVTFNMRTRL